MSAPARAGARAVPGLQQIQAPVQERLEDVARELQRVIVADFPMIEAITEHLLRMKGKMFRPTLTLLASAVEGRPEPRAIPLAAVVELVHLATLVHDDSVDHSTLRRGMPTINALFTHQISVIMGDFLYSRAVVELVRVGDMAPLQVLAHATNQMTIGEMRQLTALDALRFSEDDYDALIHAKTASLLSAACEIGALAGAPRHRQALARYGLQLGMAFQIVDDLLDYTADTSTTGKPTGLDLREHKVTLPLIHALRGMSAADRAVVEALFDEREPDDEMIGSVIAIVEECGGLEYARRRGERFADEAAEALSDLPDSRATAALRDAIVYVMERTQ
ncbi:MAG TPA: polyprenyl synthetase family protein [Gemmatimonadaceae bacterium]|nr:polyprenyl synthetase family protein [Gemmatimonadaceae bacterium]